MTTIEPTMTANASTDAALVTLCLEGDRDAFGQIVARYQSLICSLAYSATGSLGQSQDLAQETFITAWKHLRLLREREKLRAWLCGIARRLIGKALRTEGREPVHAAEPLDLARESASAEPLPSDQVVTREEEALLWRTLERIPELYREPLVLFYREHQSVESVAEALDLTEDAVKQRLSRGRRLLQDEVTGFIEGALQRSSPGKAFTVGVLAALPVLASTASAATIGASIVQGTSAAKAGSGLVALKVLAGPLYGFLATYIGYKASMDRAVSEAERGFIRRFYIFLSTLIVVPLALIFLAVSNKGQAASHPALFAGFVIGVVTSWIPAAAILWLWARRRLSQLNPHEGQAVAGGLGIRTSAPIEFRSRASFLGLPLLHVRLGVNWTSGPEVVKAWIAIGDYAAVGGIFAFGGMAVAPIAIGGFALGGLVFGGFAAGGLVYAGFAVGVWAVGGLVSGLMSVGGCALGWKAALGGIAIAREYARGGVALAEHANDSLALDFVRSSPFFRNAFVLVTKWLWPTLTLSMIPSLIIWRTTRRKRS
jgi:RNA polymerase sigma factor (sigma-70 family)